MPLPLILLAGSAILGTAGVASGVNGGVKMYKAKGKLKEAEQRHENNLNNLESTQKSTLIKMDELGRKEMEILASFKKYSDLLACIQNKPQFKEIQKTDEHPEFKLSEIEHVSIGASLLIGGIGGAAIGTLGGYAASGATTSAVMFLGTASTGTAISSLSGVAATNATMAALGGGSIAAGGGGMALGATVLSGATLGVGLLVGGIIFNITGSKLNNKAEEAWIEMLKVEKQITKICSHLNKLREISSEYRDNLVAVQTIYNAKLCRMGQIVESRYNCNVDWSHLSPEEQTIIEQTTLLVGLLYAMCKVNIVEQGNEEINKINYSEIKEVQNSASKTLSSLV